MSDYKRIKLPDDTTRDEHRLVMEKHLGRRLKWYEVVHHKDEDKKNNDFDNLEVVLLPKHSSMHYVRRLVKHTEDTKNKIRKKLQGSNSSSTILKESDVLEIREKLGMGATLRGLADEYLVSPRAILRIKKRETWKHI
jgi:hypothetical protein